MRSRYGSNIAFIDLWANGMLAMTGLFIIAFLLIKQDNKKTDVPEPPIQLMAVLTWSNEGKEAHADVDLWVAYEESGHETAVGFRSPTREGIALELDDLGARTDSYIKGGVQKVIPINREVINFRRIPAEEVTVNAMFYFANDANLSVTATVEVYRLNPFKVIYEGSHKLVGRGDEHTYVRFTMNEEGKILNMNYRPKSIVYAKHPASSSTEDWPAMHPGDDEEPARAMNLSPEIRGY